MPDVDKRHVIAEFVRYHAVVLYAWSEGRLKEYELGRAAGQLDLDDEGVPAGEDERVAWERVARLVEHPEDDADDPTMICFLEAGLPAFEARHFAALLDRNEQTREAMRLLMLSNPSRPAPGLEPAIAALDTDDRDAIADAIVAALAEPEFELHNLLFGVGLIGRERHVLALGDHLLTAGDPGWPRPIFALAALRTAGRRDAYMQIQRACYEAPNPRVVDRAQETLLRVAGDKKQTRWEVEDQLVPTCGLPSDQEATVAWDDVRLTMVLSDELEPALRDEDGRYAELSSYPDTPATRRAARRWDVVREQVSEAIPVQVHRLEEALTRQHRWDPEEWQRALSGHPLMSHLVQRAIWGTYSRGGRRLQRTFRVEPDRTLWGPDDEPFELDSGSEVAIGLVHPLELDEATHEAWSEILADYEVVTLFAQIDRPTYTPPEALRRSTELPVDIAAPSSTAVYLHHRGWSSSHGYRGELLSRAYRRRKVVANVRVERSGDTIRYVGVRFVRWPPVRRDAYELCDVPDVPYSEAVYQLESLRMPQETGGWPAVGERSVDPMKS